MKTIGTNSIRVYHVDPDADHKDCMKAFADAGSTYTTDTYTYGWREKEGVHRGVLQLLSHEEGGAKRF
jgi:hypothetical protein